MLPAWRAVVCLNDLILRSAKCFARIVRFSRESNYLTASSTAWAIASLSHTAV